MAAGEILYCGVKTGWDSTKGYYIQGLIQFTYNTAYKLKDDSVRVYYTTTPGNSNAPHVDIVPPDSTATGENILKADEWIEPFKILPFGNLKLKSPILGLTKGSILNGSIHSSAFNMFSPVAVESGGTIST